MTKKETALQLVIDAKNALEMRTTASDIYIEDILDNLLDTIRLIESLNECHCDDEN